MFKKCKVQIALTAHVQQRAAERGVDRFALDSARVAAQQAGCRFGKFSHKGVTIVVKPCEHDARVLNISTCWKEA